MSNFKVDRVGIFEIFGEYGIFDTLQEIMIPSKMAQSAMVQKMNKPKKKDIVSEGEIDLGKHLYLILEILMLSLVEAPHVLRDYCISQEQKIQKYPFLSYIVEKTTQHEEPMIQNMVILYPD